jgi:hypothetical protein
VADAWMPNARCIRSGSDGGQMQGGAPRVVWLTLDTAPHVISVTSAAQRLNEQGRPCHLVWDPLSGSIAQLLPAVRAARTLGTREHIQYCEPSVEHDYHASVNREGRLCLQICVLSSPGEPFTSSPMTGLGDILGWLDSWQIPRSWPAGQPASFRQADRLRSRALWARGGHFGGSQVPGCTSAGPGSIDIDQLTGESTTRRRGSDEGRPTAAQSAAAQVVAARTAAIPLDRHGVRLSRDIPAAAVLSTAGV